MRQRAALLRTYLSATKVALLDEPFSALDTITKSSMHDWYLSVMQKINLSTLFITHDIDEATLADRVIVLDDGKIIDDGKPESIFIKNDELLNIGLDIPFAEKIRRELTKKGVDIPNKYFTEEEMVDWLCQFKQKN